MVLSSLHKRILSALVLIPVALFCLFFSSYTWAIFIAVVAAIAIFEFNKLLSSFVFRLVASLYVLLAALALHDFRCDDCGELAGGYIVLGLLASVWASDTCAYLFGKIIGGPKLLPKISPNKTWAGLVGAILGPVIILIFFVDFGVAGFYMLVLYGALIGVAGQIGDLSISYLKRKKGVKDTGNIIPGHGGVLDRIDSLLLVAIILWFLNYALT